MMNDIYIYIMEFLILKFHKVKYYLNPYNPVLPNSLEKSFRIQAKLITLVNMFH